MRSTRALSSVLFGALMGCASGATVEPTEALQQDLASVFEPELGKGVNAAETQTYAKCLVFPPIEAQSTGFQSRLYNEYSVRTRQELDDKLDVSASVNARGTWGSLGAGGSYFRDVQISEDAFYWLVDARYVLQHESIDTSSTGFALSELAQRLLRERGIDGFTRACGSHFYVGRTLGARYNLLYEFRSHQDKFVEKIKAAAAFSTFGVDAEAELNKFLAIARKSAWVRVHSGIEGGGYSIADYASDAAALKKELERLREDLMVHRQGVVLEWEMSSYELFPEVQAAKAQGGQSEPDDYKRHVLGTYYQQFTRNSAVIAHVTALLEKGSGTEPWYIYSAATQASMQQAIAMLQLQNDEIARRATDCLHSADNICSLAALPLLDVREPVPLKDFSSLANWSIYPILRHDSVALVDFYGSPGTDFAGRIFDTNTDVFTSPAGAFVMAGGAGRHVPVLIGTFDMYETPQGTSRPRLCVDTFADICNFRIVESTSGRMSDGYPTSQLQLTLFDTNGIQTDKYVFHVRNE